MRKKLTRTGNSLALVFDKPLLEELGIDEETMLEISSDGQVVLVTPVREKKREQRMREAVERSHAEYAGVFKKLAE